jgi:hypothetical protein
MDVSHHSTNSLQTSLCDPNICDEFAAAARAELQRRQAVIPAPAGPTYIDAVLATKVPWHQRDTSITALFSSTPEIAYQEEALRNRLKQECVQETALKAIREGTADFAVVDGRVVVDPANGKPFTKAEFLGRKLCFASFFIGLVPAVCVVGAWCCEAEGLTPQIRTAITAAILIPTGLLWLLFYVGLEDHEKENLPAGIREFAKYFILCAVGALLVLCGGIIALLIYAFILWLLIMGANFFRGIVQFFFGRR